MERAMSRSSIRPLILLFVALVPAGGCSQVPRPQPVEVNLLAVNDFHGHIQPTRFSHRNATGEQLSLKAGGIGALSGLLAEMRARDPELLFVGGGDLIGGSPPLSAMWADEPSLRALDLLDMRLSVVGNHELDQGREELLRQVRGGCRSPRPDRACRFESVHPGIGFTYIAANLVDRRSGEQLFPAYRIERVRGARIAFVGAVLEDVDTQLSRQSMQGLRTLDEAQAINAQVPTLLAQGVDTIVAVVHQGGATPEAYDQPDCRQLSGPIVEIVRRLDPRIKVVLSGHTHQGYLCRVGEVLVTQAGSYGRLATHLTLRIDPHRHRLLEAEARNLLVDPSRYAPSAEIGALQQAVERRSQAVLGRPLARLAVREVPQAYDDAGESPMGNLIADAQLAATAHLGAQVALTNPGGIRAGLVLEPGQAEVSYGQVASTQPFNNSLTIVTLRGAQLRELLEQQWQQDGFRPLQPSASFSYSWDPGRPGGRHIVADSLRIDGRPVRDGDLYRITVNSFMAGGGDKLSVLAEATERLDTGLNDLEALIDYLQARDRAGSPAGHSLAAGRIRRLEDGRPEE
ncbi:bifunctional metallophosphatase/5'-nucleotidase [Azorhizophilus paspali]|uniref:Bifunctional metallophosphatase/5'-nucleotidase n=1 Tax=Azorhizophilus paspali TaxID=69963 RepID=A0ABV6SMS8_AZOPA